MNGQVVPFHGTNKLGAKAFTAVDLPTEFIALMKQAGRRLISSGTKEKDLVIIQIAIKNVFRLRSTIYHGVLSRLKDLDSTTMNSSTDK